MGGWVDGWMDGKAGLRIAYSSQSIKRSKILTERLKILIKRSKLSIYIEKDD